MDTAASRANQDQPSETHRHESLYFEDGDVIISSRGAAGDEVLFRVDKCLLARQSPVFSGLFSLPSQPGLNEEYDGVPLVRLDEPSEAIQDLLNFMYDPA